MSAIWIFNHDAMTPYNGTLTRHYSFAKLFLDQGHDITIFTASVVHNTQKNIIEDKSLFKEETVDGVRFVYVKTYPYKDNGLTRIRNMLAFYFNLKRTARRFAKPDIIYASSPQILSLLAGIKTAKRLKLPCVCEVRDLWPESIVEYNGTSGHNPIIMMLYALERKIYHRANAIIFTMEGMYDYIVNKNWDRLVDKNKCHYINNGVDIAEFNSSITEHVIDDPDLTQPDTFKVIYCGSVRTANSIDLLVDCAAELQKRDNARNIRIFVYGDGPHRSILEQRCIDENINNIKFKGFVEKKYIPYILSKSNLNVLNYRQSSTQKYGNSSNKLFEYLAAGHPVLANIDEGRYPIISKHECGLVLKERSPESYADAVQYFSQLDDEKYLKYCENAVNTAKMFDIPVLAAKLEEVLSSCIAEFSSQK
ncbi:MAG: glycosyltransferase family 4 protein [Oscillospiraceae bacterium]|nr:glycosyltransferase family 4 protein [Oscillospiraceae bacterium]MDD4413870.1 glycosyltransferase family 4 protein [Oscillospiraceae bacterium]